MTVDRLRLQLPEALREHAGEIARATAAELTDVSQRVDLCIERVTLPPIEVASGAAVHEVAQCIARSIKVALSKQGT